jgi:hypothetical protein
MAPSQQTDDEVTAEEPMSARDIPAHDCIDNLSEGRSDPCMPPHILHHECRVCGEYYEQDTETGTYEVDR